MSAEQLFLIDCGEPEKREKNHVFHDRLLVAVNRKGVKDADVVKATGIGFSTWLEWIGGDIEYPHAGPHFQDVCRYLEVSSDFLLGLKDTP